MDMKLKVSGMYYPPHEIKIEPSIDLFFQHDTTVNIVKLTMDEAQQTYDLLGTFLKKDSER